MLSFDVTKVGTLITPTFPNSFTDSDREGVRSLFNFKFGIHNYAVLPHVHLICQSIIQRVRLLCQWLELAANSFYIAQVP